MGIPINPIYQKSILDAYSIDVSSDYSEKISFNSNDILTGCSISHTEGEGIIYLKKPGVYVISFTSESDTCKNYDLLSVEMQKNGESVNGAKASMVLDETVDGGSISFTKRVYVSMCDLKCQCHPGVEISFVNLGDVTTFSSVNVSIAKEC